jgi:hypothetical protein
LKNSGDSPRFKLVTSVVAGALALLVAGAAWWCYRNGCILYYGDAESHLNISRGILDSRTPGYDQLGTVWLPVLHVICMPFAQNLKLWTNGLAGTIPVAICFIVAGVCFFAAAYEAYGTRTAAVIAIACFALNPNVLYLAVIPMTEVVFLGGVALVLITALRFEKTQRARWIVLSIAASWVLSLTRYDGWFLIPFIGTWLAASARREKWLVLVVFGAAASFAPFYWMAHNWWETGNALDFYNGPYSARAIQGGKWYPGDRDWLTAVHYYFTACRLCAGNTLIALGAIGALLAIGLRAARPILFLALTPLFYVWSMHSSGGTPIFVPSLWPFSYYNTRYGIAAVPFCAMAAAAISVRIPRQAKAVAAAIPVFAMLSWLIHPARENWVCWKESQVNSLDRRAWTRRGADFMRRSYDLGQGVLASAGDVTGVFRMAGIPLRETINIANGPLWFASITRPGLFHPSIWAVRQRGDKLDTALERAHAPYGDVLVISTSKFSPDLRIARKTSE